jgi:Na+/melibiose symporter-like transporter
MGLVGIFVLFFYNSVMGLPAALAGVGVTAGLVVDALVDPYIGFRSDHSRNPFGRRHFFMLYGALLMGPCFSLLFMPPRNLGTVPLFLWLLVTSVTFRFFSASYRIPYLSLGAELTSDYDERTRVIAVRSLFGLLGMLAGSALPFLLFFPRAAAGADPKLHYAAYPKIGIFFGAMMTLCGLAAVFGTRACRTVGALAKTAQQARQFYSSMWLFLRDSQFRTLWLSFTLCMLSVVVNFSLAVHFFKWYAQVNDGRTLSAVQTCFYVGALAGVFAWLWISRHGEKRNLFIASTLGLSALLCCAYLLVGAGSLFGAGNPMPLLAGNLLAGAFASALWVLPFSMMADVVDRDELSSGMRREGTCFGLLNLGEKVAAGAALALSGALLNFFVRLKPGEEEQTALAASRIGLCYGLIPGFILAAAALLTLNYGLDRRKVGQIQRELLSRKVQDAPVTS